MVALQLFCISSHELSPALPLHWPQFQSARLLPRWPLRVLTLADLRPGAALVLQVHTSFLSLPLNWFLPDTPQPRPGPLHPWASDSRGFSQEPPPALHLDWAQTLGSWNPDLDWRVAKVGAQPASLEQVCWGFLINKLSNRKGVIGPSVPAEEEITFLEVGPE